MSKILSNRQPLWKVLLVGGSSGTGKSIACHELSRKLAVPLLLLDDIRIAIQNSTTPESHPDIHVFLEYSKSDWYLPEKIVNDWKRVGSALKKPLGAIIDHHLSLAKNGRIIIEGDGILPDILYSRDKENLLRTVFLIEEDEKKLLHNMQLRGRGFDNENIQHQESFAHASWMFGKWIEKEAVEKGLPVIQSRPFHSICERIISTLN